MNNLRDIANNISGVQLLDEKGFDITWNYFNLLQNSIKMLMLTLTKLYMIPMVDYMAPVSENNPRKVFEEMGLTEEQAVRVQNLNIDLLNIQKALQIYTGQSFLLSSIASKFLSDLINNIPEETNVTDIDNFIRTLQAFDVELQRGGAIDDMFKKDLFVNLFKVLILFLLAGPTIQSSVVNAENMGVVAISPVNNNAVVISNPRELLKTLNEAKYYETSVDVSQSIVLYDRDFKLKYDGMVGSLISYFNQIEPSGKQYISNIVENINEDLRRISSGLKTNCLQLMKQSYDKGIFASWNSLDNIEAIEEKTQEIAEKNRWFNLFSSRDKDKESKELKQLQPTTQLTLEQKKEYEGNLYYGSKLFCSFGYNFQLKLDETTDILNVVGGKVDYKSIIQLIESLDGNLNFQIKKLRDDVQNDKRNEVELNILESTQQRLNVLKEITNKLYDIIDFSFKIHIMDVEMQSSKNTIREVKNYFDEQLKELNSLLEQLNQLFPKQRERMEQEREIQQAKIVLETYEQQTLDIQTNAEIILREQSSERDTINAASKWNATEAQLKSYIRISEGFINVFGEGGKIISGGLTRAFADVIAQVPNELVKSTLSFLDGSLKNLLLSASGWILLSVPMLMLYLKFGQALNIVRTFTWRGGKYICISVGYFVWIFQVITTPIGIGLRRLKAFIINPRGQPIQIEGIVEQPQEKSLEQIAAESLLGMRQRAPVPLPYRGDEYYNEDESEYSAFKKAGGKRLTKSTKKLKLTKRRINKLKKRTKKYNKKSKKNSNSKNRVKKHKKTKRKI